MKQVLLLVWVLGCSTFVFSQSREDWKDDRRKPGKDKDSNKREFHRNSSGLLIGYERGIYDNFQIGSQLQWKTVRLKKPTTRAFDVYIEYNLANNVGGLKASYWQRIGRMKMTYGGKGGVSTDFKSTVFSISPTIGFRLLGFHAQAGYNIPLKDPDFEVNKLFVSINYFIPYYSKLYSKKGEKKKTIFKF